MENQKITVIIPTRERSDVLAKSLQTVTSQDYENLSILVSDNYSCDSTEDTVRTMHDARIRYINTGQRVSMSANWEFALSHVDDGWVTIIGDDDGLLPGSIAKVARLISQTDTQAIRSAVCSYQWPSLSGAGFGRLRIPLGSGHEYRDSKLWLARVLSGRESYVALPMLYNGGYVSMSVVNRIRGVNGSFFASYNPDLYSAIAIASTVDKYLYFNEPLPINGASKHSIGTSSFSKTKEKDGGPAQTFLSEGNIPSHDSVPLCSDGSYPPSLQAMTYESYLQSSFLRDEIPQEMHAQQLAIILARSKANNTAILSWGEAFANLHGLDFDAIRFRARIKKVLLTLGTLSGNVTRLLDTYSSGSTKQPLRDVYEASLYAETIRAKSLARPMNILMVLCRAARKFSLLLTSSRRGTK